MNKTGTEALNRAKQQETREDQQLRVQAEILLAIHSVRTTLIGVLVVLCVVGALMLWSLLTLGMDG